MLIFLVKMVLFGIKMLMITTLDQHFMRLAIQKTREGIESGQTPFGACLVSSDERVTALAHNNVWEKLDITAHGEVETIRMACISVGSIDLTGSTIYSTTEPCPMCFSAIHWARISRIVYGASIADAQAAGFNELAISSDIMKREGKTEVIIEGGCLAAECAGLFREWQQRGLARRY